MRFVIFMFGPFIHQVTDQSGWIDMEERKRKNRIRFWLIGEMVLLRRSSCWRLMRERLTWTHVWNIFGDTTACIEEAWIDDTLQCLLFEWRDCVWNNTVVFPQMSKAVTHFCYDLLKNRTEKKFSVDFLYHNTSTLSLRNVQLTIGRNIIDWPFEFNEFFFHISWFVNSINYLSNNIVRMKNVGYFLWKFRIFT